MPPSAPYTDMQHHQHYHDPYGPPELQLVTSDSYPSSAHISPSSPSNDLPPSKKPGRGRRRDDSLPYNRARDVQRAFRARRAAHLQDLEQRVQDLEHENAHLREALRLPPSDRLPIGTGPTGRGRLLRPTGQDSQSSSGAVPDHESPPIAASTSTSTSEPSPPPSPAVPVSVNGNWLAIDSYPRSTVPQSSRAAGMVDGFTGSAPEREFIVRPYEPASHPREPFHDSPVSLGRGTIPPTLRARGDTLNSRSTLDHLAQAQSYHMQESRTLAEQRQDRPSDSPTAPLTSAHRAGSSEVCLYGSKTQSQPQSSQTAFHQLNGAPGYDALFVKREQADPGLFASTSSVPLTSATPEASGYVHRRLHGESGWTERHQAYPATTQLAQPSSSYPPGNAAIPRSDSHYDRWSTTWSAPDRPSAMSYQSSLSQYASQLHIILGDFEIDPGIRKLEKKVRAEAGEHDSAWEAAELGNVGTLVWRVEKFSIKPWPKQRYGEFFSGDSYIVLHVSVVLFTYKPHPDSDTLAYDLHFWLGEDTTLDEAGTAAYKTAELDDVLHGTPVQYREVMGHESIRFRSHFKRFVVLRGGVSTGFHHVEEPPIDETPRLYRIHAETAPSAGASPVKSPILVREVDPQEPNAVESGDVYILDKGSEIWQLNTLGSVGREKFKAAEFAKSLADHPERKGRCDLQVFDQGSAGAGKFFLALGLDSASAMPRAGQEAATSTQQQPPKLYRLSDASGAVLALAPVKPSNGTSPSKQDLSPTDLFFLDCTSLHTPVLYVWIGSQSSEGERRNGLQYALRVLTENGLPAKTPVVRETEGRETKDFIQALEYQAA
ncbi:hypothetical protein FRB90_001574 [Tulasnella sp. 427]|nr:hypothetical protein FRB90_001574 [Tulasnella sp. 427]